ncbi:hypothetical protein IQ264_31640 [Phormidium sp. LEGE 05292]|nr:hypothetical protein [Phormidium sp. LEGE 05292]
MSNQQSGKKAAFNKKWLTRISLALLAAFFSAGVSLASSEIGKQPHPQPLPVERGGEIGGVFRHHGVKCSVNYILPEKDDGFSSRYLIKLTKRYSFHCL